MRVLSAMAGAEVGGAEAFFERLVPALARAGIESRALIRTHPRRAQALRAQGVEVAELAFGGRFDLATRWGFRRQVAQFKPRVVMTWMNRATWFCPRGDFVHVGRLGGYYDLKYYRACHHLAGNTPDIVRWMIDQGWPAERAHYLPNFVDQSEAVPAARKEFYTPRDAPLVLALGRLHQNKGFDVLFKALARLPDTYLWLAGEGPERDALEVLAQKAHVKPRVRFLGWRTDVPALLAAADVFVCPSRHEPLGNVVIEAWAHRRPVVATASQGPAALIRDGETGLLVPVDQADELAAALHRVLSDRELAAQLGQAGHQEYSRAFTEPVVVAQYRAFFERVAG